MIMTERIRSTILPESMKLTSLRCNLSMHIAFTPKAKKQLFKVIPTKAVSTAIS